MGLALYRKYRPKSLSDVVGQDHITKTLKNALDSGKVSHAYLFTGPRGVGKTSIARILAHEINGIAYTDDRMDLDIIEIDAASNRRIDEIRDLRDKVHIAPTSSKYKVYIIDEVHMLTREAFNALLKTLEEPPAHAVFILATTEAHKVPDTIASRTQRFTFKSIDRGDTVLHLKTLATAENITIDEEALGVLADHAGGSFRDSINLLDQMVDGDHAVTKQDVEAMLGIPSPHIVAALYDAAQKGDVGLIANTLADARVAGIDVATLTRDVSRLVRQELVTSGGQAPKKHIEFLRQMVLAAADRDPYTSLELALFDFAAIPNAPHGAVVQKDPLPVTPKIHQPIPVVKTPAPAHQPEPAPKIAPLLAPLAADADFWNELLMTIKKSHNTLYSMLRMAQPELEGSVLTLGFSFAFHQKQMSTAANVQRISDAASALLGKPIEVRSVVQKDAQPSHTKTTKQTAIPSKPVAKNVPDTAPLQNVSSIFDGAELVD